MSEYADFEFKMTEADICGNGINIWIQMTSRGNEDDVEVKELCTYVCIKNVKKNHVQRNRNWHIGKIQVTKWSLPSTPPTAITKNSYVIYTVNV